MIKFTVQQGKKAVGIVAVITFAVGFYMEIGFADGQHTVVAIAATAEYFLVIDKGGNGKTQRCMTGFAGISGGDMIAHFRRKAADFVVMTNHAIRR